MRYPSQPAALGTRLPIWLVAVLLVQSVLANLAGAQSLTSTVKEFGLIGTWADNCKADPSPANQYASFSLTSRGTIMLRNDFGPDYGDMVYRIVDAKRIGQFRISLRQLLTTDDQIALDTVMVKATDRIRIWSSRGADGSQYVQDGLVPAANNHETGWMERCEMRWASAAPRQQSGVKAATSGQYVFSVGSVVEKSSDLPSNPSPSMAK
jgi:hypothetical protein